MQVHAHEAILRSLFTKHALSLCGCISTEDALHAFDDVGRAKVRVVQKRLLGVTPIMKKLTLMFAVALGLSSCGGGTSLKPPEVKPPSVSDVDARRLAPNEELDELLKGSVTTRSSKRAARVAIPPITVLGAKEQDWVGEAIAEILAAEMSHREQVSILERGEMTKLVEELKRNQGESSAAVANAGKILGARHMVLGKAIAQGDNGFLVILTPVNVETSERLPATTLTVRADALSTIGSAADKMVNAVLGTSQGERVSPPTALQPLRDSELEFASRARSLQNAGKLAEAQPLYAKALTRPTSSWRVEADYLKLMADLGLAKWARQRADELLARMPMTNETACDRARVSIRRARVAQQKSGVNDAREGVRAAGRCGDPSVIAESLVVYGGEIEAVDYVAARVALERAVLLASGESSAWIRCHAIEEAYRLDSDGGDWKGSRKEHYLDNAKRCADSGNLRLASIATRNAALFTESPLERRQLYAHAVELAASVGGSKLHQAITDAAADLREQGLVVEADEQLLGLLGQRLKAVIDLYGGLPREAAGLDDELLRRAGVKRPSSDAKQLSGAETLLGDGAKQQLAWALEAWATRTKTESKRQADAYFAIVANLNPPESAKLPEEEQKSFEERLLRAGLPLAKIAQATEAPPRGGAEAPKDAFEALTDHFWELRKRKAAERELREVVSAATKIGDWVGAPSLQRRALDSESLIEADLGHVDAALALARSSLKFAKDDPSWQLRVLDREEEILKSTKPRDAYQAAKARIELAKRLGPSEVELQTDKAAFLGWDTKQISLEEAEGMIAAVGKDNVEAKNWPVAGAALVHIAALDKQGRQADGTPAAIEAIKLREILFENLGDPIRTTEARVDVLNEIARESSHTFRGGAKAQLLTNPEVRQRMADLRRRLDALARNGRTRDATRLVSTVDSDLPEASELFAQGLEWAKTFEDSAEYPTLAGGIYMSLGFAQTSAEKSKSFAKSRDLYAMANDFNKALRAQGKVVGQAAVESEAWAEYERCRTLATKPGATWADECTSGLLTFVWDNTSLYFAALKDRAKLAKATQDALEAVVYADANYYPSVRFQLRASAATMAALAGDLSTYDRLAAEIRTYYLRTESSPYQWATTVGRFATSLAATNPKVALAAAVEFDRANGASDFWKASQYGEFAVIARLASDRDAEAMFVEKGRSYAATFPMYATNYILYSTTLDRRANEFAKVGKAYQAASASVAKLNPGYVVRIAELDAAAAQAAIARRDLSSAASILARASKHLKRATPYAPCLSSYVAELEASVASASGVCAKADDFRRRAAVHRASCVTSVIEDPTWKVTWTDGAEYAKYRSQACRAAASTEGFQWP